MLVKEAMVLLELALWKANLQENEANDAAAAQDGVRVTRGRRKRARKDRYNTSGASIMIKNVLPLLALKYFTKTRTMKIIVVIDSIRIHRPRYSILLKDQQDLLFCLHPNCRNLFRSFSLAHRLPPYLPRFEAPQMPSPQGNL